MAKKEIARMFPGLSAEAVLKGRSVLADVTAKYYGDPDYRRQLDADPTGVFKSEGIPVPKGRKVKLLVSAADELHFVFPWVEREEQAT